ncbi:hypothetical protein PG987_010112 [Apiospora arundinis]
MLRFLPRLHWMPETRRVGIARRHDVRLVVASEREDEVPDVAPVGLRRVEPVVERGAAGEVALLAEDVGARRELGLDLERAEVEVGDGRDAQLDVRELDGRLGRGDVGYRDREDAQLDAGAKLRDDDGVDAQHLERVDLHAQGEPVRAVERLEPAGRAWVDELFQGREHVIGAAEVGAGHERELVDLVGRGKTDIAVVAEATADAGDLGKLQRYQGAVQFGEHKDGPEWLFGMVFGCHHAVEAGRLQLPWNKSNDQAAGVVVHAPRIAVTDDAGNGQRRLVKRGSQTLDLGVDLGKLVQGLKLCLETEAE